MQLFDALDGPLWVKATPGWRTASERPMPLGSWHGLTVSSPRNSSSSSSSDSSGFTMVAGATSSAASAVATAGSYLASPIYQLVFAPTSAFSVDA